MKTIFIHFTIHGVKGSMSDSLSLDSTSESFLIPQLDLFIEGDCFIDFDCEGSEISTGFKSKDIDGHGFAHILGV